MESLTRITYYTSFTVFVLTSVIVIFSLIVAFLAFLYWSGAVIVLYFLRMIG